MGATHFTGPVTSTNGFVGEMVLADPLEATDISASGDVDVDTLAVGASGTVITKILKGTVAVNPSSLLTMTGEELAVTLTGAEVGDAVILHPPAAGLTTGMLVGQAYVSAADTVTVQIFNASGGTINEASANWIYCLIRS